MVLGLEASKQDIEVQNRSLILEGLHLDYYRVFFAWPVLWLNNLIDSCMVNLCQYFVNFADCSSSHVQPHVMLVYLNTFRHQLCDIRKYSVWKSFRVFSMGIWLRAIPNLILSWYLNRLSSVKSGNYIPIRSWLLLLCVLVDVQNLFVADLGTRLDIGSQGVTDLGSRYSPARKSYPDPLASIRTIVPSHGISIHPQFWHNNRGSVHAGSFSDNMSTIVFSNVCPKGAIQSNVLGCAPSSHSGTVVLDAKAKPKMANLAANLLCEDMVMNNYDSFIPTL